VTPAVVDTSVWIDFLRGTASPHAAVLHEMIQNDTLVFITPAILQELLMGAPDEQQAHELRETLLAFGMLGHDAVTAAAGAAELYRAARRQGVTVRKSIDCLIAWQAVQAGLPVLHKDRDFDLLSEVSDLAIVSI
jgi:predicted nucleic acid-binding protein